MNQNTLDEEDLNYTVLDKEEGKWGLGFLCQISTEDSVEAKYKVFIDTQKREMLVSRNKETESFSYPEVVLSDIDPNLDSYDSVEDIGTLDGYGSTLKESITDVLESSNISSF